MSEHEDIQVVEIPLDEALKMVETGEICNATTIIALQWLELKKLRKSHRRGAEDAEHERGRK